MFKFIKKIILKFKFKKLYKELPLDVKLTLYREFFPRENELLNDYLKNHFNEV